MSEPIAQMTALPRYLYVVPPMAIALSLFVWQLLAQFDWLEIAFGHSAWLYWVAALLWVGSATPAVRRVKRGALVLLAAPAALFPAIGAGTLFAACMSGTCL